MSVPPYPLKVPFDQPYFEIDVALTRHPSLSADAKAIFEKLCAYNGPELHGYGLLEYLEKDLEMPLIVVVRHLTELKRAGVVL